VAARRRELGLRSALGASRREIVGLVFADCARLVALGGGAGLVLAFAMGTLLAASFPGATAFDPAALGAALVVLAACAALAASAPSLSAARVDPATVLREE
jgi:ABC-type antimicrobial peptide transport system permease subunit